MKYVVKIWALIRVNYIESPSGIVYLRGISIRCYSMRPLGMNFANNIGTAPAAISMVKAGGPKRNPLHSAEGSGGPRSGGPQYSEGPKRDQ